MERKRTLSRGLLAPAEDEGDTDALFDAVVVEQTPVANTVPLETPLVFPNVGNPPSLDQPPAKLGPRAVLHARMPASPIQVPPAISNWPTRIVYEEGGLRDLTIFKAPLEGDAVESLVIIDPYATAGERNRRMVVDFAKLIIGDGVGCGAAHLVSFDAESARGIDYEDSNQRYDDMLRRWSARFPGAPLRFDQVSKQGNRSLHGREIRAKTRSGRTVVWDLGHGIDGVMTARYRCVVNLSEC